MTSDRSRILDTAALEIELYVGKLWFRGVGGAPRVATSVLETVPGDVPAVGAMPASVGVSITSVEQWSDEAEDFAPATYIRRPLGTIRVPAAGTFRIVASVLPSLTYPTVVDEAVARLFSYRQSYKPRLNTSELADGERAVYHGRDDAERGGRVSPIYPRTWDLRWPGSSEQPSIAAGNGRRSERRARRRRAVCVKTAAGLVSSVIIEFHFILVVRFCPT